MCTARSLAAGLFECIALSACQSRKLRSRGTVPQRVVAPSQLLHRRRKDGELRVVHRASMQRRCKGILKCRSPRIKRRLMFKLEARHLWGEGRGAVVSPCMRGSRIERRLMFELEARHLRQSEAIRGNQRQLTRLTSASWRSLSSLSSC